MKKTLAAIIFAFTAMALLPLLSAGGTKLIDETAAIISEKDSDQKENTLQSSNLAQISKSDENSDNFHNPDNISETENISDTPSEESNAETENGFIDELYFKILDTSCGNIITVDDKEFCCGALAYEMLPGSEKEALKAQCIACYTHFCKLREQQRADPDSDLKGADFSADLSVDQFYISNASMKKRWEKLYDESRKNIEEAVNECAGTVLTDKDGKLIDAAYHALSSGRTENASDIFGITDEHLVAAASPWDKAAADYLSTKEISLSNFYKTLSSLSENSELSLSKKDKLGKIERTASGAVINLTVGSESFDGQKIRKAFELRSADFDIKLDADKAIFTVRGYGHGVGLSQNGAQCMAQQGSDYREILMHYYSKCSLSSYKGISSSDKRD